MTLFAVVLAAIVGAGAAAPAVGQVQAPSVKDAQNALIDALAKRDRAAFERLIDADGVFFLPGLSQGRDAIVNSWIIFLVPSNATISLSPIDAVVSSSQDLAYTTGTFVLSAQKDGRAVSVMSGSYLAVWRLTEGQWMLKAFTGAGERAPAAVPGAPTMSTVSGGGLGPYRFGMPLDEVRKVDACTPYMDVRTTGGLECPNYMFEGRKINISFIFASNALRRIQLWLYEGASEKDARKAVDFGIEFLKRTAGDVHMYGLKQGTELNGETIIKALKKESLPVGRGVVTELQTPSSDAREKWFARISRNSMAAGDWFGVFLFVEPRVASPAR